MKILVYGAGNIGCLYAAKLREAGHHVAILARGERFRAIEKDGIILDDFRGGEKTVTRVDAIQEIDPASSYDLILVILPKQAVAEVLPILAANQNVPSFMFFGNNASGPGAMIEALGRERVLLGFPGAAAIRDGDSVRYLILDRREQPTTIGELDGSNSQRIVAIKDAIESAGFPASISSKMDAWLKTHVAEISPTANALYMAGNSIEQLKGDREVLRLMLRAIREGNRVLKALGIPTTPSSHKIFQWIPEFLLLRIMRRKLDDEATKIKIGHAADAFAEMKVIADEFHELVLRSGIDTPAIDQLRDSLSGVKS